MVPETIVAVLLLGIGVLAVLQRLMSIASRRTRAVPFDGAYFCLVVYLWAVNPAYSFYSGNRPTDIAYVTVPFLLLGTYYLCTLARVDEASIVRFSRNQVIAGCLLALVIIFFGGSPDEADLRATTLGGNDRTLVLPVLPMAAVMAFSQAVFLTARSSKRRRATYIAAFLICTVGIVMTVTRAMLLAELIGCLIVIGASLSRRQKLVFERWRVLTLVAGFGIAIGAIVYQSAASWEARLDPSVAGNAGTVIGRIDEIGAFMSGFRESPLFGKGLGYRFSDPGSFDLMLNFGIFVPHNHFAFVAGTMGIVGLALYYGVLVGAWRRLRRVSDRPVLEPEYRRTMIALFSSLATGVAFTLTSTGFTALSYNLLVAVTAYAGHLLWEAREVPFIATETSLATLEKAS